MNSRQELALNRYSPASFQLVDDGTLDTVIMFKGVDYRFSDTSEYRDNNGSLDLCRFIEDYADEIVEDYEIEAKLRKLQE